MKQILLLLSGHCLVVEMDKFTDFDCPMEIHGNKLVSSQSNGLVINTTKLPEGNWRIIGMLGELTEEMATTVVKECIDACECTTGYVNYNRGDKPKPFCLDTAIESLESAIEAAGYTFENKERCPQLSDYDDNCFGVTSWDDMPLEDQFQREKWEAAQSRVLDRSRCLLLGRED